MIRRMKKLMAGMLAAAMVAACVLPVSADSPVTPGPGPSTEVNAGGTTAGGQAVVVDTKTDGTAALGQVEKTSGKKVTISPKVEVDGVKYTVTTVDAKAFAQCKKAKTIDLPATITKIKKNAFQGAKSLKTIELKGKKAVNLKVANGAFADLNTKKMTVKVNKNLTKKQVKKIRKMLRKAGFKGKVTK